MVYTNRYARELGNGEIFIFPPAPLLTSNWQDYLEHLPNILGMWFIEHAMYMHINNCWLSSPIRQNFHLSDSSQAKASLSILMQLFNATFTYRHKTYSIVHIQYFSLILYNMSTRYHLLFNICEEIKM